MGGGSSPGHDDLQETPSTREPIAPVHERSGITQLPGVFVPKCQNGSIIYPTTTQKSPTAQRRVSIVPPAPSTTLNCSLLSQGDDVTMDWVPQAGPVFRRPSRCMSIAETSVHPHSPISVEELVDKAEVVDVSGEAKDRFASETLDPCCAHDGIRPESTVPTATHQPFSVASARVPDDFVSVKNPDTVPHDPRFVLPGQNADDLGRYGYKIWSKPHMRMQRITAKVRDHLAGRRKIEAISPQEAGLPNTCSRESCQYVLDDIQVQRVVEIVFEEMCKQDSGSQSAPAADSDQATGDSVTKWPSRKPSCLKYSIEPRPSTTAGPATTISEPETSFVARSASDGQIYSKIRPQQAPATKIVSQGGSTNIQWLENSDNGLNLLPYAPPMLDISTDNEPSRISDPAAAHEAPQVHGFSLDHQLVSKSGHDQENIKNLVIHDDENKRHKMTSFPALSKRHCTNDWLSPPANLFGSKDGTDMYHLGIDARSGSMASITRVPAEEKVKDAASNENPCQGPLQSNTNESSRSASEAVVDIQPHDQSHSLLTSAESGRQRSAQLAEPLTPEHPGPKSGLMQKLTRKISSVFQGSDSVNRQTRAPAPSETEGQIPDKLTGVLSASRTLAGNQDPEVGSFSEPEPDAVYQAMTLLKPSKGEPQRRSTCSEDNIPHQCEDDLSTSEVPTPCAEPTP